MRVKEEREKVSLKLNIKETKIMASGPITSWQIEGEKVKVVTDFLLLGPKIIVAGDCNHEIRRWLFLGYDKLDSLLKSNDKCPYSHSYGHIRLWELDCKEGRMPKNWYLQTAVLEKTPESSLDSKEIKPVNLKGN